MAAVEATSITIPVSGSAGVGFLAVTPPTFLEKWGVLFVSFGGAWMLVIAAVVLSFYLRHFAFAPAQLQGVSTAQYKEILDLHKTAADQFRDSLNFIFDLLVTKTVLPLVTLLLGYLFGSKKT